jgi:hypothetical protein
MWLALIPAVFAQAPPGALPGDGEDRGWRFSATAATGFVSGTWNDGASGESLSGDYDTDPVYNPALRFSLTAGAARVISDAVTASASWTVSRDQIFCDTCEAEGGYDPGTGGATGAWPVEAGDLQLRLDHRSLASLDRAGIQLIGALTGALPASRDAFVCNPFYGAAGAQLGLARASSQGELVQLRAAGSRSFFAHANPPLDHAGCSPELTDYDGTQTLSGTVEPSDPWEGSVAGFGNADWSVSSGLLLWNPHAAIVRLAGALDDSWFEQRLITTLSLGVSGRRTGADDAATVETLDGEVTVAAAENPMRWSYPVAAGIGVAATEQTSASLTISNAVPRLLTDPGAYYRALPARSSLTLSIQSFF